MAACESLRAEPAGNVAQDCICRCLAQFLQCCLAAAVLLGRHEALVVRAVAAFRTR